MMVGRRSFPFGMVYFQGLCYTSRGYPLRRDDFSIGKIHLNQPLTIDFQGKFVSFQGGLPVPRPFRIWVFFKLHILHLHLSKYVGGVFRDVIFKKSQKRLPSGKLTLTAWNITHSLIRKYHRLNPGPFFGQLC